MHESHRRHLVALAGALCVGLGLSFGSLSAGTTPDGFFDTYLILGPYSWEDSAVPSAEKQSRDYMCDGEIHERNVVPEPGGIVGPPVLDPGDCDNDGAADIGGLGTDPLAFAPDIDELGNHIWREEIVTGTTLNQDLIHTANQHVMAYAAVWVINETGAPLPADLEMASDDGISVMHNYVEVWNNPVNRGTGADGTIQDTTRVVLVPGNNLFLFKTFEHEGGWGLRARLSEGCNSPLISGDGRIIAQTELPIGPIGELPFSATRTITDNGDGTFDVSIAVDADGAYDLVENFGRFHTASGANAGGSIDNDENTVSWTNVTDATLTYTLTRDEATLPSTVDGTLFEGGTELPVFGDGNLPGTTTPYVGELLVSPPFTLNPPIQGCNITPAQMATDWISGDGITDATIVPEEGGELTPDFGGEVVNATGWSVDGAFGNIANYLSDPADPFSTGVLNRATPSGAGLYNWEGAAIFGGNIDLVGVVAFFYVENNTGGPWTLNIGVGADDSESLRLNGEHVFAFEACRPHPGFADKTAVTLKPGKNLFSLYVFENGGGWNGCIRFENELGQAIPVNTTLDPSGYTPGGNVEQPGPVDPGDIGPYSALGFVTQFLVPNAPLSQGGGATNPLGSLDEDYISMDYEPGIGGEAPSISNVFLGARYGPGTSGLITTDFLNPTACGFGSLVLFDGSGNAADPGLFNGETFYGAPDNYSSTLFFFLNNKTDEEIEVYPAFASDDGASLFVNGQLIVEHGPGRGFGGANVLQTFSTQAALLEPGDNLVQLSYVEGGGGSGARVAIFADCQFNDILDTEVVGVSALPSGGGTPAVTVTRSISLPDCDGNGVVTLSVAVDGGGSATVEISESLPVGIVGSNPSQGTITGESYAFSGEVNDGDTITYDYAGATAGLTYCLGEVSGPTVEGAGEVTSPVGGDTSFVQGGTDYCGTAEELEEGLFVNCGGPEFVDLEGRTWLEDTLAFPSQHLVSVNIHTANFTACGGGLGGGPDISGDDLATEREYPPNVFPTERWDNGDLEYTFTNLPQGNYEVVLLFMEGCCSDGCEDIDDPALSAGGCRVFDVSINGEIVEDQFSQNVQVSRQYGTLPGASSNCLGITRRYEVQDTDRIDLVIDDLGNGNPPENASIKGLAITLLDGVIEPTGTPFIRADANVDGAINLSDPVAILNTLFLGIGEIVCNASADANADGAINLSDPVAILNTLFLGIGTIPAPNACGEEPLAEEGQCNSFPPCAP